MASPRRLQRSEGVGLLERGAARAGRVVGVLPTVGTGRLAHELEEAGDVVPWPVRLPQEDVRVEPAGLPAASRAAIPRATSARCPTSDEAAKDARLTPLSATVVRNRDGIEAERAARAPVVDHLPYYYSIHLNKPCNQRCIMCVPDFQHRRDVLSFEGFVALFEQIEPYAEHVTLIGGETFMYPEIPEVLELLGRRSIEVTINTNATMLNDRVLPGLLGLHALNLKCSIHAATPETYHRVHGRDHFERVTENMRRFAELSRDLPDIRLITVYVVMRENLARGAAVHRVRQDARPPSRRVPSGPARGQTGKWRTGRAGTSTDGNRSASPSPTSTTR